MLKLKELREEKNILQKDIAQKMNITTACISSWETNKTEPDLQSLIKLADILDVTTDYLLGRSNDIGIIQTNANLSDFQNDLLTAVAKLPMDYQREVLGYAQGLAGKRSFI